MRTLTVPLFSISFEMFKQLLTGLFIFYCLNIGVSASEVVLNLDQPIKSELLLNSEYFEDLTKIHDMNSIAKVPDNSWTAFNRKQFRFGLTNNPIWVRTKLVTQGNNERNIILDMHGVIDHIQLQVKASNGSTQQFKFGKGSKPKNTAESQHYYLGKKSETDHVTLLLSPNVSYDLLLKINSNNAVIGSFRAIEPSRLDGENKIRTNGITAYLFLVFLVMFYSAIVFITTRDKAFFFHAMYVLSVTGYLLNSFGFLESWLGISNLSLLETLLIFCLASTLLSLLAFFKAMIGQTYQQFPQFFKFLYRLFLVVGIATLCLVFLIPYTNAIRLLAFEISLAMVLAPFLVFYRAQQTQANPDLVDTRLLRLKITLFTFTAIGGIHVCTRLGLIDVHWFTNYILFVFILIEALLYALVIFLNINNDKKALFKETFYDRQSLLPNEKALKKHFLNSTQSKNLTLVHFWVSGFDRLEISLGNSRYREFISAFGEKLSSQLSNCEFVVASNQSNSGILTLFNTGKNNFAVLCERLSYKKQLLLHRLITETLSQTEHLNHDNADFKVIIGADGYYPERDDYETVTQNCLLALAQGIKSNNNIRHYDESLRTSKLLRRKLIGDFEQALENEQLFLLWQPQYDVKSKQILSVEVFSRWEHPEHGLILPEIFIPLLEKSNRICQLSKWVIQQVFATLPTLHKALPETEVSINLSPQDLITDDLIDFLDEQIQHHPAHLATYVVLEIPESIMINDYSVAFDNIKELQLRGFKVSIENFGSGLASFSYLQTIPTDELKVDKSFSDRYEEPTTYTILNNIISLSKRLGIRLVIEGLETKQQVDLFKELGVERLQGFAISKPLRLPDLLNSSSLSNAG